MSDTASVAVIVVNYGTADLAVAAVDSVVSRQHGELKVDVHLVDNASPDDSAARFKAEKLRADWEGVTLYLEAENHGFGRGNNIVFNALSKRETLPDFVFLLNPDAQVTDGAIETLVSFLRKNPKAAVAGARITKPQSGPRVAAFRFPSASAEFAGSVAFGPVSRLFANSEVPLSADIPAQAVDWVAGAAVAMRFDVVRELQGFDPEFFLYFEEVELMRRIVSAGHEVWFVPEAEVLHEEGAATQVTGVATQRRRKPAYWYRSWGYYFHKTHGRAYALWAALCWMLGAGLNAVIARLRGQAPSFPLMFWSDFWQWSVRPLLGLGKTRDE